MAVNAVNDGTMSVNSTATADDYFNLITTEPVGDTWRGLGSDWFNESGKAEEDWKREQQAAQNQLYRDLYMFEQEKDFAREQFKSEKDFAREQWQWEKDMSDTAYQRAVQDMKKAGINPVMAVNQGGASTPTGVSASARVASASRSSSGYRGSSYNPNTTGFLTSIISLIAGIYGAGAKSAAAIATANIASEAKKYAADTGYVRDVKWRNWYDKRK